MANENGKNTRETKVLAEEIWRQYPGKWIIYSEDEQRVLGVADTLEEASDQAHASGVGGEWHYHHAFAPDEEIFGSL